MTVRHKVSPEGLAKALDLEGWKLGARLVQVCRKAAEHGRTRAQMIARQSGMRATGTYERSFIVEDTEDGAIVANTAKHAYFVERGRRVGKPPPAAVILRWLMDKGAIKRIPVGGTGREGLAKTPKTLKGRARRIFVGVIKEVASQRRTSKREAYIADCWSRAFAIAREIGKRGVRGKFPIGRSLKDIKSFIRRELAIVRRGA